MTTKTFDRIFISISLNVNKTTKIYIIKRSSPPEKRRDPKNFNSSVKTCERPFELLEKTYLRFVKKAKSTDTTNAITVEVNSSSKTICAQI